MAAAETEWDFYPTRIEDQPALVALDLALADEAPMEDKPWLLWISIKLQEPTEDGFPTAAEAENLSIIEDALAEQLEIIDAVQAGRIQIGNLQDLYFYAPTKEEFEDIVLEVMESHPDYLYATDATKDKDWDEYLGNLYPDYYDFQCMLNRKVTDALQEQGDRPDAKRPVDHLIYFAAEKGRASFSKEVENMGYAVLSAADKVKGTELPYPINISRDDNAIPSELNASIWRLCQLAEKYDGQYDSWGCEAVK